MPTNTEILFKHAKTEGYKPIGKKNIDGQQLFSNGEGERFRESAIPREDGSPEFVRIPNVVSYPPLNT